MKKSLLIFMTIFLFSCSGGNANYGVEDVAAETYQEEYDESYAREGKEVTYNWTGENTASNKQLQIAGNSNSGGQFAQNQPSKPQKPAVPTPIKTSKKIIKTGNVRMEVKSEKQTRDKLAVLVKKHNGYISNENQQGYSYQLSTDITIRVVPENYEDLMSDLKELAVKIEQFSTNSKDVTEQFVDIQTRLKSKRDVAERYRVILQKANTVEDILKVENSLRVIVEEIEALEGRLRYLKDQVGYSTINLNYYETLSQPYEKKSDGFFTRVGESVSGGWNTLLDLVVGLFFIWPLLLIGGGVIFFVRKQRKVMKSGK